MYRKNTDGELRKDGSPEQGIRLPPQYGGVRFRPPVREDGGDMTMRRHKATESAPARVYRSGGERRGTVHYSPLSASGTAGIESEPENTEEESAASVDEDEAESLPVGNEHADLDLQERRDERTEKERSPSEPSGFLSSLLPFLSGSVSDDILLGALILLLAHEGAGDDVLLLLGLLLAFGKSE